MGIETAGYLAIKHFKNLEPPEQRMLASRFLYFGWEPRKKEWKKQLMSLFFDSDDGLDHSGLIKFLTGEDSGALRPSLFGKNQGIIMKLSGLWQEAIEQFNKFLFKKKPGFRILKKGYDSPLVANMPTHKEFFEVFNLVVREKRLTHNLLTKVLPKMAQALTVLASVKPATRSPREHWKASLGDLQENSSKKWGSTEAQRKFGQLEGTLHKKVRAMDKLIEALFFFRSVALEEPTLKSHWFAGDGTPPSLETVGDMEGWEMKETEFYKKQFPGKASPSMKGLEGTRKQLRAWSKIYKERYEEFVKILYSLQVQLEWFKTNMKNIILGGDNNKLVRFAAVPDLKLTGIDPLNLNKLSKAQNLFNNAKENLKFSIPFYGPISNYDRDQSPGKIISIGGLVIDGGLLVLAITGTTASGGLALLPLLARFIAYETAVGLAFLTFVTEGVVHALKPISDAIDVHKSIWRSFKMWAQKFNL